MMDGLRELKKVFFPVCACISCSKPRGAGQDGLCEDCRELLFERRIPAESCERCLSRIPRGKPCPFCQSGAMEGIRAQYAPFMYREPVRGIIHSLKFGHESLAADVLAGPMADSLKNRDMDCIVPVPLHRTRLRERGYNQSLLLAERVGALTHIPVRAELLTRQRSTRAQSSLSHDKREENVKDAFLANEAVQGLSVLLLDDVRTGGSTARACARALLDKGACEVSLLTAAVVWDLNGQQKKGNK